MASKYERWLVTTRGYLTIGAVALALILYGWRHFLGR
jgi:hypothetical protein